MTMNYAKDDIVEYQFERMPLPRVGRVLEVSENGLYVLDGRTIEYLPFALAYIRSFYVEDRDEVYGAFVAPALAKLEAFKHNVSSRMLCMGDSKILEQACRLKRPTEYREPSPRRSQRKKSSKR